VALLRTARFLMTPRYPLRTKDCAWIVYGSTNPKLLGLDEVATVDKFGPHATVLTGEIAKVDGVPVLVSSEMPLTQADGKADAAANTKGQALCVYRPGWVIGYRRRIAATMDYLPYYDAYQMVATVRLAFGRFDNDVASVLYNITV